MAEPFQPDVSVVLPIYNAEKYILDSLGSLLSQTLRNIEVICVDDGSTDKTSIILDELAAQDERIVAIHQKNGGAGAARNAGIAVARGRYLSILDADDWFQPNMLERAYGVALAQNLDIIAFRSDEYYPETKEYKPIPWTIHEELLPTQCPFAGTDVERDVFKLFVGWSWDKLFRTDFIREEGLLFQEIRTTNDMRFVFSAIIKAQRIGILDDVLVHHRKDIGSLSVTREKSWGCFYEALISLRQQLQDWGLYERFEQDFINYCVHASLWNVRTLAEPTKTLLKERLAAEWYDELGVTFHDEHYFYNKSEYRSFLQILGRGESPVKTKGLKEVVKRLIRRFR